MGEKAAIKGLLYVASTYLPSEYPAGWEVVSE